MPKLFRFLSAADRWIKRYFWWIEGSLFLALLILVLLFFVRQRLKTPYDLIISGGRVFDGEKFLAWPRDVGLRDGKVAGIGFLYGVRAKDRKDARGKVVAPGFIDTHVHVEASMVVGRPLRAPNFVKMGVTTMVTGNCGTSHGRLREILDSLQSTGSHVNVLTLVGHNTIREEVMGQDSGAPSQEQLLVMKHRVEDAMRAGAYGLSTGLQYAPGVFSGIDEVVELAKVARSYDGIYVTHVRDEGRGLMGSLREAVAICRKAAIPLHVSHLKRASRHDWEKMGEVLKFFDRQRSNLPSLTHDVYAYTRSSSSLDLLLPPDFRGTLPHSRAILGDQVTRKRLVQGMMDQLKSENFTDYRFAQIAWFRDEQFWGKDIPDLDVPAPWLKETSWVRDLVKNPALAREVQNVLYVYAHGGAQMIYEVMDQSDMMAALKDPHACIGTDSGVRSGEWTTAHPRSTGNFPKIIGELVRSRELTLEEALRKMTSYPASIFGLPDHRGWIRAGAPADLVVFDPETVSGPADYGRLEEPKGIDYVIVNGKIVAQFGKVAATFPGTVIREKNQSPLEYADAPPALSTERRVPAEKNNVEKPKVVSKEKRKRGKLDGKGSS